MDFLLMRLRFELRDLLTKTKFPILSNLGRPRYPGLLQPLLLNFLTLVAPNTLLVFLLRIADRDHARLHVLTMDPVLPTSNHTMTMRPTLPK